jgi:hypothetical protein
MSPPEYELHARRWVADWNAHNLDGILDHYAEDAELVSPFVARLTGSPQGIIRGHAALREYFGRALAAYPSLRFDLFRVYPGLQSCVIEYRSVNGLHAAETVEFNAEGKIRRVLAHYAGSRS